MLKAKLFGLVLGLTIAANPVWAQKAREVKALPTCIDFTDVYARAVLGEGQATEEDQQTVVSLAAIMMGYVSAMQDVYGNYLVGMGPNDNEWTLLEYVHRFCKQNPQLTFQRAVRSVPAVADTIQSLQDQEFARCTNYINQTRSTICATYNKPQQ